MSIITINNLHKRFNDQEVLKGINLVIEPGQITSIIGSSGSGKSTLLRCINQLESYDEGSILYYNLDITSPKFDLNKYRSKVTMIFQQFNLFSHLSVIQNCMLAPMEILKVSREEAISRALVHLKQVNMDQFINKSVLDLSGGQKQRVAIARALCMQPEVLLLDEPTSALDPQMVEEVLEVIKNLANLGMTMVIVSHEMNFVKQVSDKVVVMSEGVIVEEGSPQEIFNSPSHPYTQQFLNKQKQDLL